MTTVLELRCPVGPRALLSKMRLDGEQPNYDSDNRMMLACRDCARNARGFDPTVKRVIHHFDFLGNLVESVAEHD